MSLPSEYRLKIHKKELFENGRKIYTKYFTIILSKDPQLQPKFAIVVSKKVSKLAVKRNFVRRQISTAIKDNLFSFPKYNFLVLPKNTVLNASFFEINNDLLDYLKKLQTKNV